MTKPLIVNNTYLGSALPVVIAVAATPTQVYRNTDNTMFVPTKMILTNITAVGAHRIILVDADITDGGTEETYKDIAYDLFDFNIGASLTVVLDKDDMPGLQFRYGVGGYVTDATLDVTVYIEGYEVPTTSTE